jgi:hypothetical protein
LDERKTLQLEARKGNKDYPTAGMKMERAEGIEPS